MIKDIVAAGTLGAVLAAGSCAPKAPAPQFGDNRAELQTAFAETQKYWSERDAAAVGEASLKTLVGGSFACVNPDEKGVVKPDYEGGATYCHQDRVVIVASQRYERHLKWVNSIGVSTVAAATFTTGHEVGHLLATVFGFKGDKTAEERAADCIAGDTVAHNEPGKIKEVKKMLEQLDVGGYEIDEHGTAQERAAAFQKGVNDGADACGIPLPPID
jgi:predicted metalloprotease